MNLPQPEYPTIICPECGSDNIVSMSLPHPKHAVGCWACGYIWEVILEGPEPEYD